MRICANNAYLLDGVVAELDETAHTGLGVSLLAGPLLGGRVKEGVTPQPAEREAQFDSGQTGKSKQGQQLLRRRICFEV
jgi:hypothetical protein